MADDYLSGNVREKLALARKSAELYPEDYTVNVEALERVQPKDRTASEIAVRLGATWLPTEIVEQFMFCLLYTSYGARRLYLRTNGAALASDVLFHTPCLLYTARCV